jgi:hypothetical protein
MATMATIITTAATTTAATITTTAANLVPIDKSIDIKNSFF